MHIIKNHLQGNNLIYTLETPAGGVFTNIVFAGQWLWLYSEWQWLYSDIDINEA